LRASRRTSRGLVIGPPGYMSPEQYTGKPSDPRSDIFSLGVVLYELLTGRRPFSSEDPLRVSGKPVPPADVVPTIPRAVSRLVVIALNPDPNRRYQSMDEFLSALETALPARGNVPR